MPQNDQYLVDVIGFNPTERAMLTSVFALAARRDPGFVQFDPVSAAAPDLYLVDIDDAAAFGEFRALNRRGSLPAVLVASPGKGGGHDVIERPLQWARLLQALEDAIVGVDETLPAPLEPPLAHPSIESSSTRNRLAADAGVRTPLPGMDISDIKRALGDTVLVVDDNATVRMFMQAKLAPFKFEIDFAETGEQAVGLTGDPGIRLRIPRRGDAGHRRLPGVQADQGQQAGDQEDGGGDAHQPQLAVRQAARIAGRVRRVPDQAARRGPLARGHRAIPAQQPQASGRSKHR